MRLRAAVVILVVFVVVATRTLINFGRFTTCLHPVTDWRFHGSTSATHAWMKRLEDPADHLRTSSIRTEWAALRYDHQLVSEADGDAQFAEMFNGKTAIR